jgi:hypothetical protein
MQPTLQVALRPQVLPLPQLVQPTLQVLVRLHRRVLKLNLRQQELHELQKLEVCLTWL